MKKTQLLGREFKLIVFSKYLPDENCSDFQFFLKELKYSWKEYHTFKLEKKVTINYHFRMELAFARVEKVYEHNQQLIQQGQLTEQEIKRIKQPKPITLISREKELKVFTTQLPDENSIDFLKFLRRMKYDTLDEYQQDSSDSKITLNCFFRLDLMYQRLKKMHEHLKKQQQLEVMASQRIEEPIMIDDLENSSINDSWWSSWLGCFGIKSHLKEC